MIEETISVVSVSVPMYRGRCELCGWESNSVDQFISEAKALARMHQRWNCPEIDVER